MRKRDREKNRLKNWNELLEASIGMDCELVVLNKHPMHIRIFGQRVVDYWPATGKAWIVGSNERGQKLTPAQALDLAGYLGAPVIPPSEDTPLWKLRLQ